MPGIIAIKLEVDLERDTIRFSRRFSSKNFRTKIFEITHDKAVEYAEELVKEEMEIEKNA